MSNLNNIQDELLQVAPNIINLADKNVYTVPNNYFNCLSDVILIKIKSSSLSSKSAKSNHPYLAPDNYFDEFSNKIASIASAQNRHFSEIEYELNEVAPLLNSINKNNIYTTPTNYFEQNKINPKQTNSLKSKWWLYAAAAVFFGITCIGIIKYINTSNKQVNLSTELAKANDEELTDFLDNQPKPIFYTHQTDEEEFGIFEGTETDELIYFLNNQPQKGETLIKGI